VGYDPESDWTIGRFEGKIRPQYDLDSEGMTCGREAWKSAGRTETADVIAGSQVGFHVQRDYDLENVCPTGYQMLIAVLICII